MGFESRTLVKTKPKDVGALVAWSAAIAIAYVLTAKLGFSLAFTVHQVSAVWPPTGIAVAAFVLGGSRVWPGIFIGAFIANLIAPGEPHEPIYTAGAIAVGNTIGPLVSALLLQALRFDSAFSRVSDVLVFVFFGSFAAMTITATNGVLQLILAHITTWATFGNTWALWWTGDAMGVLLIAPFILTWSKPMNVRSMRGEASTFEILALLLSSLGSTALEFFAKLPAFPLYPFVVWSAIRMSARVTTTAIVLVSILAVYGTVHDTGPFRTGSLDVRLMELVTFTAVLSIVGLVLSAMTAQRRLALTQVSVAERRFHVLAETVPQIVWTANARGDIDWVNKRWFAFTGLALEEATPNAWHAMVHPDDAGATIGEWTRCVDTGQPMELETRLRRADGVYRWFLVRGEAMRDERGKIIRWYGTTTDIDEQHRALDRSARIAKTLQSAFLPESLPTHPQLEFDALYLTAGHEALIGGDWYDAFTLPDGRIIVSIGDVMGHGLSAAVSAGRIRQTILAMAVDIPEPEVILTRANRLMQLVDATVATAFVALVDPAAMTMRYASAGHPPPVVAAPNTPARALHYGSIPLGVDAKSEYAAHTETLERDACVLFYTDGVTELERDIDRSERALLDAMNALVARGPVAHAADVIRSAVLGEETPSDDAVIMVMRMSPSVRADGDLSPRDRRKSWSFHSSHAYSAHSARREVMQFIERFADAQAGLFDAELILGEILANTVEHAPGLVNMEIDWSQLAPVLTVIDAGPGLERFTATLPDDALTEDGRGLFLVKALASDVLVESAQSYGTKMTVVLPLQRRK